MTTLQPGSTFPDGPARMIPAADVRIGTETLAAASRVLASGWVSNGPEVEAFESEFRAHVTARSAVAVSSGVTALELALRSLGLPPGSRVLISALTSPSVVQSTVRAGLRPVLMDVSSETGLPTPDLVSRSVAAGPRGGGSPRGMVIAHWAGNPANIRPLADAAGLDLDFVVEDATQALGAQLGEQQVGGQRTVCFSFYATRNLPIGEGGMVTTDNPDRAAWIRTARLHGRYPDSFHRAPLLQSRRGRGLSEGGLDSTLTDLSAAVGREQLRHLAQWQQQRSALASRYDERLAGLPGVRSPARPAPETGRHAWHHYPVRIDHPSVSREAVLRALAVAGVATADRDVPVHQLSYCRGVCEMPADGLPGADLLASQLVSLPIYPRLPANAADRVASAFTALLG